jgi:FecR protein
VNKVLAFLRVKVLTSVPLPWRAGSQAGKLPLSEQSRRKKKSPAGIEKEADMKTTSAISTAALLVWMLVGLSSRAQEPVSPATAAGSDEAVTASSGSSTPVSANSKVRIVRLSEVKGEVLLDRLTGKGFESSMTNLPVIEGAKLKTGNGVAEIEFEDNSTVRVAENSLVEFPRLELLPGGAKASTIQVVQGMVYVSLVSTKGNEFSVKFGQQTVNLPPDSHIRLQVTPSEANLAVMHGDVTVEQASGSTTVGKNKTATFNMADAQSQPVIAKGLTDGSLDQWDSNAVQYHKSYANASSFGNAPYAYGINDLNYYGSFVNGCGGSMWRPYFTSASWDPYGSGAWAYYSGAGYSWVSPYPWGWTPYHYGSWAFCQGLGWGWQPGGAWLGLANNSFVSPTGFSNTFATNHPRPPLHAPTAAEAGIVAVNLKAIPASSLGEHDKFVFRNNSAGLGVPRGSLGKLNSFSIQTAQHGTASMTVYSPGARGAGEGGGQASSAYSANSRSYSSSMQSSASAGPSHSSMQSAPSGGGGGGKR